MFNYLAQFPTTINFYFFIADYQILEFNFEFFNEKKIDQPFQEILSS